jgi:ligand-binding SRPBCC domain-containing protein
MRMHLLERTQVLPASRDEVFAFFQAPDNLARITPSWLGFRILTPLPLAMREGALIDYTVRWLGMPARWTTLITSYEPPVRFVDQQLRGPYSFWHHTHEFRATPRGTVMTDRVRYVLPAGPVGVLLHTLLVRRQLEEIFDFRRRVIAEIFAHTAEETVHP